MEVSVQKKVRGLVKPLYQFFFFFFFFVNFNFLACASGICMQLKRGEGDPR